MHAEVDVFECTLYFEINGVVVVSWYNKEKAVSLYVLEQRDTECIKLIRFSLASLSVTG